MTIRNTVITDGEARLPRTIIAQRREIAQHVHAKRMRGETLADAYERLYSDPAIRRDVVEQSALEAIARGVDLWIIGHATGLKMSRLQQLVDEFDNVESV